MLRRVPAIVLVLTAALLLPSGGQAALPRPPVITKVTPLTLGIGDTLTIKGRNFRSGRNKNMVVFQRARARAVFVKADRATSTTITMRVPARLLPFLSQRGGRPVLTRFRLRILARRFGLAFTPTRMSPRIGPVGSGQTLPPEPTAGVVDCDHDGVLNTAESDDDNDLLSDSQESGLYRTNPCNPDSDGDTIEDGYEVHSALDLNSRALPYPAKRPYPNALDADDGTDYDGDGLTQREEYSAWIRYYPHALNGAGRLPAYSDGDQTTQGFLPIPGGQPWLNTDDSCTSPPFVVACEGRLWISDDELDVDGDGIGNWDEIRGVFSEDNVKHMAYKPLLDYLDPDTDGDTVLDGDDDQDHDDVSNLDELQDDSGVDAFSVKHRFDTIRSNALDPCFPSINSRSCPLHPEN